MQGSDYPFPLGEAGTGRTGKKRAPYTSGKRKDHGLIGEELAGL